MKRDQALQAIEERRLAFEAELESLSLPDHTPELYEPIRHVLATSGKRVRPLLVLLTAEAFGGREEFDRAMPAAISVELFHAFTLVHDDIMDGAEKRRGHETIHVKWDEPTAILAGDFLFGMAYDQFLRTQELELAGAGSDFHATVAALCEGQALDMAFEKREDVTLEDYVSMIDRKTAALLAFCLSIGGRIGGANEDSRRELHQAGIALGRAFQIQDDLLDLTASSSSWGKEIGSDLLEGKRTFLLLKAIEEAPEDSRRIFLKVLKGDLEEGEVSQVLDRMNDLGVLDAARDAVAGYVQDAIDALDVVPGSVGRELLFTVVDRLAARGH